MADMISPFKVAGPCISILGSTTAPSGTLINMVGDWTIHAFNRSTTQDAYLAYGPSSDVVTRATVPVVGEPAPPNLTRNVVPIPHATVQTFTFSGPTYFGAITAAGNVVIDLTPGAGT
jgi:hypothetical protein